MSSSIINRDLIEAAYVTYSTIFDMELPTVTTFYKQVVEQLPNIGDKVKLLWLGTVSKMQKWTGDRPLSKLRVDGHVLETEWYANGLECDQDDLRMDSDTFGLIPPRIRGLAEAAEWLRDEMAAAYMMAGFGATLGLTFDGQYLFDSDHQVMSQGGGTAQSNLIPGVLSSTTFNQALVAGMTFKDENGTPVNAQHRRLITGPANQLIARQLLLAEFGANGATNIDHKAVDFVIWPRITSSMWWLQNTGTGRAVLEGTTVPAQFAMVVGENSIEVFMRRRELFGSHIKIGWAYGNWWNVIGGPGT